MGYFWFLAGDPRLRWSDTSDDARVAGLEEGWRGSTSLLGMTIHLATYWGIDEHRRSLLASPVRLDTRRVMRFSQAPWHINPHTRGLRVDFLRRLLEPYGREGRDDTLTITVDYPLDEDGATAAERQRALQ